MLLLAPVPDTNVSDTLSAVPPGIVLIGDSHILHDVGEPYQDQGTRVIEIKPTNSYVSQFSISTSIEPELDAENPEAGDYAITYTVDDGGVDATGESANPDTVIRYLRVR